jgi:hypothetical protein
LRQKQERRKDGAPSGVRARRAVEEQIPVEIRGILPIRQKKGEWMGHGAFVFLAGKVPSGPKGHVDFAALSARLKSCPDTKRLVETRSMSFSATCNAQRLFCRIFGTTKVVP